MLPISELKKTVLLESEAKEITYPKRLNKVTLTYKIKSKISGNVIDEEAEPVQLLVGDKSYIEGFNIALIQTRVGEKALYEVPGSLGFKDNNFLKAMPGVDLSIEIHILECQEVEPGKFDVDIDERHEWALKFKSQGVEHFKSGEHEKALERFEKALDFIEWERGDKDILLKVSLLLNISLIANNLGMYARALSKINWAINLAPENPKCYFRKASILEATEDFEGAYIWFKKALEVEPTNKDVKLAIKRIKEKLINYQKENVKLFSGALRKEIYEDKLVTEYSDNLNKMLSLQLSLNDNSEQLDIRVELFWNIVPDTVLYFEERIIAGIEGAISSNGIISKNNYVLFESNQENLDLSPSTPENFSIKFKDKGYLFFKVDEVSGTFSSTFGISLAPLPWFDNKYVVFGHISSKNNWWEKLNWAKSVELRVV